MFLITIFKTEIIKAPIVDFVFAVDFSNENPLIIYKLQRQINPRVALFVLFMHYTLYSIQSIIDYKAAFLTVESLYLSKK